MEITKVRKGVDPDHKVSIVIRKNGEHKSDGTPHSGYTEYVYEPSEVTPQDAANAVVKGVKSLLETGEFVDETGKAVRRDYPYTDNRGRTMYSLITPEMDAAYLDAVNRGDMATAQRMVMEAAKLAMPNTKVVDENGEPKVVWHGGQFGISSFIPRQNMHFGTKKAAMQRILDEQWGYDNWLVQNEDGSYSWKYEDEYDEANNVQSNKTFATEDEAMEDALLYLGNEVVVKPYFLNIRHLERTDDAQSSWDDAIEVVKAESDNVDGIVYENWYEDKGTDSYIAFESNQIKSADPVTYDDNGNVIPLSERFNPENEDIRYSLSNRPTGLLNDFTEEFEALQKEYESLDPTTIHAQHPFRIRKRKVVQKYLNHVSEVLGLPCEVFVLDSSNEQQMRTAYRKYVASRQSNGKTSVVTYEEFKEEISDAIGEYFYGTNMVVINIDVADAVNTNSEYLGAVLHENVHKIIEKMGVDEKVLEAIYEEAQNLAKGQVDNVDERYPDASATEKGEEIIAFALQTRASFASQKNMLMQFF